MPELSKRSANIPASPIRKLVPFADQAKAKGIKVYHLNIGQPDLACPTNFWEGIQSQFEKVVEYSHSAGIAPLRQKAAKHYTSIGITVDEDQVMVTTAGSEALLFALAAICDQDDEVIVPEPMYANYIGFAASAGVNVVSIPTHIEDNFALPSTAAFAEKITPKTKAIVICNPGNPTGTVYSNEQLEELAQVAKKFNLFLIADEVYREFNYTGKPIKSVLELEGVDDYAIMIDSASKRFSLCGSRIGFLVSRNKCVMDAALRMGQARLSPPTLEQFGVLAALDAPQSYFDDVRTEYMARRDLVVSKLQEIPGVVCPKIDGAFYATVQLPVADADDFCQWLLESFSLDNETVMLAPASGFYSTPGAGKDQVRIAYVLKLADLERSIELLKVALEQYGQ